jgi:hypothetical protein
METRRLAYRTVSGVRDGLLEQLTAPRGMSTVALPGTQGNLVFGYSPTTGCLMSVTGPATGANGPVLA